MFFFFHIMSQSDAPKQTLLRDQINESNKPKMKLLDGSVGNVSVWKTAIGCCKSRYNQLICIMTNLHEKINGIREGKKIA